MAEEEKNQRTRKTLYSDMITIPGVKFRYRNPI